MVSSWSFALIVIVGSMRVGIGWGAEGPKAGFLSVLYRAADPDLQRVNFVRIAPSRLRPPSCSPIGVSSRKVMSILVPTAIYVAMIPWIGIYVASIMLIAVFMRWLGRYDWTTGGCDLAGRAAGGVSDFREVVSAAVAEGTDRGASRVLTRAVELEHRE